MMEDPELEEHLHKLGWFEHRPPAPYPRVGHVGEHVYADEWQAFMLAPPKDWPENVPNENLHRIMLRHRRRGWIRKYDSEICARIVCWLGTNIGRCFASDAEALVRDARVGCEAAFVMAWSQQNTRHHFLNGGYTTIEHLLAKPADSGPAFGGGTELRRYPRISNDAAEVAECLIYWLGSNEGAAFRRKCEKKIEEINRFVRITRQAEHKAELVRLGLMSPEVAKRVF